MEAALAEVFRVLRPGGALHFLEHGRSPDPAMARWQDRLQPVNGRLLGGCYVNRPIADLVRRGGFDMTELQTSYLHGPSPFTFAYLGLAHRP